MSGCSGGGDSSLQAAENTPSGPAAAPADIRFTETGVVIGKRDIRLPCPLSKLTETLGKPTRTFSLENTITVWDTAGLFAYSGPNSDEAFAFSIAFNDCDYQFWPKGRFSGAVHLDKHKITADSTAADLRRADFLQHALVKIAWRRRLGELIAHVDLDESGKVVEAGIEPTVADPAAAQ